MIRPARAADGADLANLVVQLGYRGDESDVLRRLTLVAARPDDAVFVAVHSDRAVGFVHVCTVATLENDPYAEIRGLVVDEAHRSRRIGEELVAAAEAWARERGLLRMRVRSNVKRERARLFYERHGYQVTKLSNMFDKEL